MHIARSIERIPEFLKYAESHSTMQRALSNYFRSHREMGSRDRKLFRSIVYANRRLGRSLPILDERTRTLVGIYLVGELDWNQVISEIPGAQLIGLKWSDSLDERLSQTESLGIGFKLEAVLPTEGLEYGDIDMKAFRRSVFVPPRIHIRIKKGFETSVSNELESVGIPFERNARYDTLSFDQGSDLESLDAFKEGRFEIQDLSSQLVARQYSPKPGESWWDVCAASGGKTLGLLDQCDSIRLLSSDIRPSILENLKERLRKSGSKNVDVRLIDASNVEQVPGAPFDAIIADVPCTGSGTWSRTPEQISRFDLACVLAHYVPLQRGIIQGVTRYLKPGGKVHYSTCSVFKAENEGIVNWMVDTLGYRLVSMNYFSRYFDRADTLFSAILTR